MSFTFSIPNYISTNGGQLLIKFTQFDSYIAISESGGVFTYPTSLTISDASRTSYSNAVVYYSSGSNTPHSIQQITLQICGSNPCSGTVVISNLIRSYYPLTTMTQTIQLATTGSDSIATNSFSVIQDNSVKNSQNLVISVSNSVTTLSSSYVFNFISDKIPI